jgi:TolB-like protein
VLFRDGEVVGEGVNVAARIRGLAEPGGICVSASVYEQVKNHPHLRGRSLGSRSLKGVARPVEVVALSAPGGELPRASRLRAWLPRAAGAALLLAAALFWVLGRAPPAGSPGHSLAVLPFVNLSADPDQEYFADGIAEELLNTVARFEGVRVVGRTSSFSFRNSDADLKTIGRALGADVILEGSVRTAGNRVRITAQLVDAGDGFHRWSETYERELEDIFAIQTEIATAIATALRVELSSEERARLATPLTRNLEAYQAYLLGRHRFQKKTTATTEEAIRYFERAIELAPTFALAHADRAIAYIEQVEDSGLPPDEMLARAEAAAGKALELDDHLAEAHVALAMVRWYRNDLEGAEAALQRALVRNPNSVDANRLYAVLLAMSLARYEEAVALSRKAVELDPLSLETVRGLGQSLHWLGRFEEGLTWYERALEIDPAFAFAHARIGEHHRLVTGQLDEAVVWWAKAVTLDPRSPWTLENLGLLFLELGAPDRAEYWIHRSLELGPENVYAQSGMQRLALYRGDEDAALHHGRKAFAIWPYDEDALTLLRDRELAAGRFREARALYEPLFPELLSERDPRVDLRNYRAAIDLAGILSRTGERERADRLLDLGLEQIAKRPRLGLFGYGIADVQIYALRGERQKALSALRQAIDEGWRRDWWYWLEKKPDLEPLHGDPEYQAMVEEIRADMAAQLERVREMEAHGELVLTAEPAAPGDRGSH